MKAKPQSVLSRFGRGIGTAVYEPPGLTAAIVELFALKGQHNYVTQIIRASWTRYRLSSCFILADYKRPQAATARC